MSTIWSSPASNAPQYDAIYSMPRDDIPAVAITNNCIVLDLDQTLIATQDNMSDLYQLKIATDPKLIDLRKRTYHIVIDDLENPGVGTKTEMWGVTRPHLQEFLIFQESRDCHSLDFNTSLFG